jgi:protein TonB
MPGRIPHLDEPGRRLLWTLPLALLIWLALLMGFSAMLELTTPPPPEHAVEARLVELPPEVGGLQGGPAQVAPVKAKPAVVKPAPIVHPRVAPHPHIRMKRMARPVAPSETGTAKSEEAPPPQTSGSANGHPATNAAPGGIGSGGGTGMGSDTAGARAIYAPTPEIPDELREDALDTVAVAHFKVGYDGQVEVTLAKPTSSPRLNQILLETLKQWKFFPAVKRGVASESEFDLRIPISVQ